MKDGKKQTPLIVRSGSRVYSPSCCYCLLSLCSGLLLNFTLNGIEALPLKNLKK
jgi:hypothetical protein